MNNYSSRIKELRTKAKMSQAEFAKVLDYSQGAINRWEGGTGEPNIKTLIQISKYFDVNLDYLLGTSDSPDASTPMPSNLVEVSQNEKQLLLAYRILPPSQQVMVCRQLGLNHPSESNLQSKMA